MKLLRLLRRRKLAYELLREYDIDNLPVDPERFRRSLEVLSSYVATHPVEPGGADRWRAAIERVLAGYPHG